MAQSTKERVLKKLEILEKYQKMNRVLAKESDKMEEFVAKFDEKEKMAAALASFQQAFRCILVHLPAMHALVWHRR